MAGKLNLGITLTSYDKIVVDELQSSVRKEEISKIKHDFNS
jgi:hypothetical protein